VTQKYKMKLQNKHDKDDRWVYERNSDTGQVQKRRPNDYGNEQLVNPEINSVPTVDYEAAALNLNGIEWIDFINSLTKEQKIKLSQCWD